MNEVANFLHYSTLSNSRLSCNTDIDILINELDYLLNIFHSSCAIFNFYRKYIKRLSLILVHWISILNFFVKNFTFAFFMISHEYVLGVFSFSSLNFNLLNCNFISLTNCEIWIHKKSVVKRFCKNY